MPRTLATVLEPELTLPQASRDLPVSGITADSREVKPGFIFAALPGTAIDGASFIPQAFAAGAVAVIAKRGVSSPHGLVLQSDNPRHSLAIAAARFHGAQPELMVAVTGTNGKTSIASFTREIWEHMGFRAASLGTIGIVGPRGTVSLSHTTPDPVAIHHALAALAAEHVNHAIIEASSHGLAQNRLDGIHFAAGAFTNLTRDHLDYHGTLEAYFKAKMRLFEDLLPRGAPAVIALDGARAADAATLATGRGLRVFSVGRGGTGLDLLSAERDGFGQKLRVRASEREHQILLPLAGAFQLSNALVAAGLVIATGGDEVQALHALELLKGAKGRLDLVGRTGDEAPVYVDYAHTPDAIVNALQALRPYVTGRLIILFGAGGDRDPGKRPLMGKAASDFADMVIVTDDNPRTEDPARIRQAVLAGAPGAIEIADRDKAIATAVGLLRAGDVLLVSGKGHEPGQVIGRVIHPFSDHEAVKASLRGEIYRG